MTCKDNCLHWEVCKLTPPEYATAKYYTFCNCAEKCECFKDKSKYIELPCKVGDMVYWIGRKGGKPFISEEIVQSIYCDVRETIGFTMLNPDGKILKSNVFLTKSEAEQKLKEMQNG